MRTVGSRCLVLGSAALLALAGPARLAAQVPLVPGGPWNLFEWVLGLGPLDPGGFSLSTAQDVRVRLTDAGFTGDAFDLLVSGPGGPIAASTPSVPGGIDTGALTGDDAWADPRLSKTELLLGPGNWLITVDVREAGSGFQYVDGFIRADLVRVGVIPEPTSVVLLATGAAGLLGIRLRARRRSG